MMYDMHFYANNKYLGSAVRGLRRVHAEYQRPYSYAWFCPDCADVWARVGVFPLGSAQNERFTIQGGQCDRHPGPSPYHVPGTMLIAWDDEFNNLLLSCPDAVKREFELHMKFYERSFENV